MIDKILFFLDENKPTPEECKQITKSTEEYSFKTGPKPYNKFPDVRQPTKYHDYVPPELHLYDDSIVNLLTNNTCVFIGKNAVRWEVRCGGCGGCMEWETPEEEKYFINPLNTKQYTWENMKIFFDFNL